MLNSADNEHKKECLLSALFMFKCSQDADIELFLQNKAIDFLSRGLCSVYLIPDEDKFLQNEISIVAYFTLSHKALCVPEKISKSKIQKIGGFKTANSLHFVLIGQLGKYISKNADGTYIRSPITSKEILDYAFEVINASSNLIPCKCVLVECSNEEKVKQVYENYQFKFFQNDGKHNQYYKAL